MLGCHGPVLVVVWGRGCSGMLLEDRIIYLEAGAEECEAMQTTWIKSFGCTRWSSPTSIVVCEL
jgi:hypothetical protein